jgi:hypothetical protein
MNEGLPLPIERIEESDAERMVTFANFILAAYRGEGMGYDADASALQKELEKGKGAPGDSSYILVETLFLRIRKDERPLFLQAIAAILSDPEVPQYTKAALLFHSYFSEFTTFVHPAVIRLVKFPPISDVLMEALRDYGRSKLMDDAAESLRESSAGRRRRKHRSRTAEDYELSPQEREFSPHRSREIIPNWVIDKDEKPGDFEYGFYPFGKPCKLKYGYLRLETQIFPGDTVEQRNVSARWYDTHTLDDFLQVAAQFMQDILGGEEHDTGEHEVERFEESPPGIYIQPDKMSTTIYGDHVYIPFSPSPLTREGLETALRKNRNFINYSLDECAIEIVTPKGNLLFFTPSVLNDPDRHRMDPAFPREPHYSLEVHGSFPPDLLARLITTNNHKNFPEEKIASLLALR